MFGEILNKDEKGYVNACSDNIDCKKQQNQLYLKYGLLTDFMDLDICLEDLHKQNIGTAVSMENL